MVHSNEPYGRRHHAHALQSQLQRTGGARRSQTDQWTCSIIQNATKALLWTPPTLSHFEALKRSTSPAETIRKRKRRKRKRRAKAKPAALHPRTSSKDPPQHCAELPSEKEVNRRSNRQSTFLAPVKPDVGGCSQSPTVVVLCLTDVDSQQSISTLHSASYQLLQ